MGGSLRNPASFCGVVGMRPCIGRVAHTPEGSVDMKLGQQGPMARNVEDLALLLDAMIGADPRDPLSLPRETSFLAAARRTWRPKRVAGRSISASPRSTRKSPRSRARRRQRFAERRDRRGSASRSQRSRMSVSRCCARYFFMRKAVLLREHRDKLKPEVIWNIEKG